MEAIRRQSLTNKAKDPTQCFNAMARVDDSLYSLTGEILMATEPLPPPAKEDIRRMHSTGVESAVRIVFARAVSLGLIVPGKLGQSWNWSPDSAPYHFTPHGLDYFHKDTISLAEPSMLLDRLREIAKQHSLNGEVIALVGEAQTCWKMGCLRAAVVMLGVAVENTCLALLDELQQYPVSAKQGSKPDQHWRKATNEALSFHTRWESGLAVLEAVKSGLKTTYGNQKPDWWSLWESVPNGIAPFGEAVRVARNAAAHSLYDTFSSAQVGLLLASLPTMLAVLSQLKDFIATPPPSIHLPALK